MELRLALFPVAALLVCFAVACEPGTNLEYINNSSQQVTVYEGGEKVVDLKPGATDKTVVINQFWTPEIKVVAEDGRVLLEDHITLDELPEMGGKMVITDPEGP